MTVTGTDAREQVRQAARGARAEAGRVRNETHRLLRDSRRLATLVAEDDAGGAAGRAAFNALPVAAALLDASRRVVTVNPAWRRLRPVSSVIGVGGDFGAGWSELTGDTFVEDALAAVVRNLTPLQAETTVRSEPPLRLLVQMGPAALRDGAGALVVLVDVTSRYEREQQLLFEATHDVLTQVANRAWLLQALDAALQRYRRYGEPFALVYLDLDAFKPVNDRYGHAAGDQVLHDVAARWREVVRTPDLLARVGGDEFVVLVAHAEDTTGVETLTHRLVEALHQPFRVGRSTVRVGVTAGVARPPADTTADDALALADQAMYEHKPRRHSSP